MKMIREARCVQGKKYFVTLKNPAGTKEHFQKRLILWNIREVYLEYKSTFAVGKKGFLKFVKLQPKWCRTRYIPHNLIFKLEDSKDSNCVSHNTYIHTQRKELKRSHFLS